MTPCPSVLPPSKRTNTLRSSDYVFTHNYDDSPCYDDPKPPRYDYDNYRYADLAKTLKHEKYTQEPRTHPTDRPRLALYPKTIPVHMKGRIYDPMLGRFLSADLLVDGVVTVQGFNRYSYVHNNALIYVDPSGYLTQDELEARTQQYANDLQARVGDAAKVTVNFDGKNFKVTLSQTNKEVASDLANLVSDLNDSTSSGGSGESGSSTGVLEDNAIAEVGAGESSNIDAQAPSSENSEERNLKISGGYETSIYPGVMAGGSLSLSGVKQGQYWSVTGEGSGELSIGLGWKIKDVNILGIKGELGWAFKGFSISDKCAIAAGFNENGLYGGHRKYLFEVDFGPKVSGAIKFFGAVNVHGAFDAVGRVSMYYDVKVDQNYITAGLYFDMDPVVQYSKGVAFGKHEYSADVSGNLIPGKDTFHPVPVFEKKWSLDEL